ncbi:NUDIX domain-containing protein [Planococcus sp. ISL-110]|uniref:NUDIX hydrolase n=1 Tax=Planococcus sp. ISL-110 TaxID=2819167 RepID=UPI001BE5A1B2|nr:NUDIX domain-containing protein [Planococcus sp. ISL-110]MBT2571344.1 NUDIX domain-containing protein [Planococcus sp. ISL-110]
METEKIRIYDEQGIQQGIADRKAVHENGYWHETFHCWLAGRQGNRNVVYLQLRSEDKKDFPGLFDITAAGHLLADETVEDGIREIQEELGIQVDFTDLTPLGMIKDQIALPGFLDNERCQCFLYQDLENVDVRFELQLEEVSGMAKLDFEALEDLFAGKEERVDIEGFEILSDGSKRIFNRAISLKDLVPHSPVYFEKIAELIGQELSKRIFYT